MDWMEEVAATAESRLAAADIRLTLGGEPTMVPLEPSGAEWSISADGPTKLPLARNVLICSVTVGEAALPAASGLALTRAFPTA